MCSISLLVVATAALIGMCVVINSPANWVFDPKVLQDVAKRGMAAAQAANGQNASAAQIIQHVILSAKERYPNDIKISNEWLFNNAGGAMGSMTILHASFSEYLIIFGTAVGTEGHTGRFFADDYFTIIYGEQWAYLADSHEKEVYRPGDQHHLPWLQAKQYKMPDACWALEYARGNIPSMMGFGLADSFSSTLDVVTLWQTVRGSAINMLQNALRGKL
jgi:C-8 sterol isomerase